VGTSLLTDSLQPQEALWRPTKSLRGKKALSIRGDAERLRRGELYVLVHRDCGPIGTFLTAWDADDALMDFVEDEPDRRGVYSLSRPM
jgi:hypothetical protein